MNQIKKLWPYLLAVIVFAVVACVYMSPVLDGKVIATSDGIQGRAAVQEAVQYHQQTGDRTWWTGSMFSGMPNYQIGGGKFTSDLWLKPIKDVLLWGHNNVIAIVLLYCLGFFALLRSMKVDKWLSIVGALAIAFSSYFFIIIGANHHSKTSTLALMSAVVAGFYLIFHGHRKTGICLTMLCTAAGFFPHPQMAYYVCFILAAFWVAELCHVIAAKKSSTESSLTTGSHKGWAAFGISTAIFAAAFGIGVGTGTGATFTNLEYAAETMRGGGSDLQKTNDTENKTKGLDLDYATAWSYGIDECWTFLVPDYMGGSSNYNVGKDSDLYKEMVKQGVPAKSAEQFCQSLPMYWGDQPFTAGPVYMGAIVCLLFVLGLFLVKGPYKWAILAVTLLSVMLSWGHNWMGLTRFFFDYVPMYNKFRAVSSILIIAEITMPLLGFLALKRVVEIKQQALEMSGGVKEIYKSDASVRQVLRSLQYAVAIIAILLVLCVMMTSGFTGPNDASIFSQLPEWLSVSIMDERHNMLISDAWRSCLFAAAGAVVIFLFIYLPKFKGTAALAAVLGVLILADMWQVDKRYMNDGMFSKGNSYEQAFKMQPWEKMILDNDKDPNFRVFNIAQNPFNDARTSYRLKSIGGYSAAKLRRYQDLIDEHLSQMHRPVINMLNTKYYITQNQEDGQLYPVQNPDAMGNAWYVDTLVVVNTANEESDALMQYDLHTTAVLDQQFASLAAAGSQVANGQIIHTADSLASVRLTSYSPKRVEYDAESAEAGTVVFSEIYYPHGWKATVDGQAVEHYRVNYLLRALNLPAGKHHITFEFLPDSVEKGNWLSMFFVITMFLIIAGCIILGVKSMIGNKRFSNM